MPNDPGFRVNRQVSLQTVACSLSAVMLLLVYASCCHAGSSPSNKADAAYKKAYRSYSRLASSARLRKDRRSWIKVIKNFRKVYLKYPEDRKTAPRSLYMMARCYRELYGYSRRRNDLNEAVKRYNVLVEKFPDNRFADDALYAAGQIYSRLAKVSMAKEKWKRLVREYPASPLASKAKKKLKAMGVKDFSANKRSGKKKTTDQKSGSSRPTTVKSSQPKNIRKTAVVTDIQHWSARDYTRVVIHATSPVRYKDGYLAADIARHKPRRLYLDLSPAHKKSGLAEKIRIQDGLLKGVRIAQFNRNTVRVVFDLNKMEKSRIFYLESPFRIVVDAYGADYDKKTEPCPVKSGSSGKVRKGADGTISIARQLGLCVNRVVIDAGHGGKDPGAIGPTGLKEKDVVLKVALKLAKRLRKHTDCQVVLTRSKDRFLPLTQRTAIANAKKADLFVSIHANSAPSRSARGIETYFLNFALDKDAMRVAALENATSGKRMGELKGILNDIMKNTKVKESSRFASVVQKELVTSLAKYYRDTRDLGVKQAPFFVLVGARMPSILVEINFISNRVEERRLKSDPYLDKIADGLLKGIVKYMQEINR